MRLARVQFLVIGLPAFLFVSVLAEDVSLSASHGFCSYPMWTMPGSCNEHDDSSSRLCDKVVAEDYNHMECYMTYGTFSGSLCAVECKDTAVTSRREVWRCVGDYYEGADDFGTAWELVGESRVNCTSETGNETKANETSEERLFNDTKE